MTRAETIAAIFDDDSGCFETDDGQEITSVCRAQSVSVDRDQDRVRYNFADKSAIIFMDGAWDLPAKGCRWFCWESEVCSCGFDGDGW